MLSGLPGSGDGHLRDRLAGAFDDPELELALWNEATGRWTDEHGTAAPAPVAGPGRAVIELQRGDSRAGAVVTDQTWTLDDDLVRAVGVAASLELDNQRLVAGRSALVAVADEELRRLERDLHDGAQQQLVAATLHLSEIENGLRKGDLDGAADRLAGVRADLHRAISEVRTLSAGGMPAELEDFGLAAAVESLAARSAIPLKVHIELPVRPSRGIEVTAWFVICEALANAGKHAAATRLGVSVEQAGDTLTVEVTDDGRGGADPAGRGLRALAERVASASGQLTVDARPAGGTLVRASLPHKAG
jgi:signal transduction histidine kinase